MDLWLLIPTFGFYRINTPPYFVHLGCMFSIYNGVNLGGKKIRI